MIPDPVSTVCSAMALAWKEYGEPEWVEFYVIIICHQYFELSATLSLLQSSYLNGCEWS